MPKGLFMRRKKSIAENESLIEPGDKDAAEAAMAELKNRAGRRGYGCD